MLKVLLVDDEEISRNKLERIIVSQQLDVEIIGMAEDGEMALEEIKKTVPDLVITDIRMPFMDGLELMKQTKNIFPEVYFIFISGHDEFKYAQQALKLGAHDYILKPIEPKYLAEKITAIMGEQDTEKRKREKVTESTGVLKRQFINDLLYNKLPEDTVAGRAGDLGIDPDRFCSVVVVQIDDYYAVTQDMDKSRHRELLRTFFDLVDEKESREGVLYKYTGNMWELILFIAARSENGAVALQKDTLNHLRKKIRLAGTYTVSAGIGTIQPSLEALSNAFFQALEALNYKFIAGENRDFYFEQVAAAAENRDEAITLQFDIDALSAQIDLCNKYDVRELLSNLRKELLKDPAISIHYVQMTVTDIYLSSIRTLAKVGGSIDEVFSDGVDVYRNMMTRETAEKLLIEIEDVLFRIMDYIQLKREGKYDHIIVRAKNFIGKNYARSTLSLDEVANASNMSPCYFAVIFKQEVGKTLIEYLTALRMEKAKELLSISAMKSYEISYEVGYENPTYFSSLFKKNFGMSPTEYRKQLQNNE